MYKVFHAKKEATYGTDAAPTAAANAVLTRNLQGRPVEVDRIERNRDRVVRGRSKDAPSNARQTITYDLEVAGSGAAGTAPAWMEHLEACGMAAPVITAGQSAEQRFAATSAALSSLTAYHWINGQRRRGVGGRGSFNFAFTAGSDPIFSLSMTLLLHSAGAVDDVAPGAGTDVSRWGEPLEVNDANTDFLLGGFALKLQSMTGQTGSQVSVRNLVNQRYVKISDQAITGTIMGKCPTIAEKNYFASLLSGAEIPFVLTQGTAAGNIVEFKSDRLQITSIETPEDQDELMISIGYALNVGTTPDDLIITAK